MSAAPSALDFSSGIESRPYGRALEFPHLKLIGGWNFSINRKKTSTPPLLWIGLSALNGFVRSIPWGVAPGWYESGLRPSGNQTSSASEAKTESAEGAFHISLGHRPRIKSNRKRVRGLQARSIISNVETPDPGPTAGPIQCRPFGPQNRCIKAHPKLSHARNHPSLAALILRLG